MDPACPPSVGFTGTPEQLRDEVADVVAFLPSDAVSDVYGSLCSVDGGAHTLRHPATPARLGGARR